MPRKTYPSDMNREQFEKIRPELEAIRQQTKPPTNCATRFEEVLSLPEDMNKESSRVV